MPEHDAVFSEEVTPLIPALLTTEGRFFGTTVALSSPNCAHGLSDIETIFSPIAATAADCVSYEPRRSSTMQTDPTATE